MKKNKGITLIALVITIILLLILAGITISLVMGPNGLFSQAKQSKEKNTLGRAQEDINMVINEWTIENTIGKQTIEEFLIEKTSKKSLNGWADKGNDMYELERQLDGGTYTAIIDKNGKIINEVAKVGARPEITNEKVVLNSDGTGDAILNDSIDSSATDTIYISFSARLENGKIKTVTCDKATTINGELYVTPVSENGIYTFTITGEISNEIVVKKYSVKVNQFIRYLEADSLLDAIKRYDFETGKSKVNISDVTYNLRIYSFEGDKEINENTAFGEEEDVATENTYANNIVVVKVNGNLTIDEGVTLTAYSSPKGYGGPKGLMIYCTGTLTNNGIISMTAKGAKAEGENVYLWKNADGSYEYVPAQGANGGSSKANGDGNKGNDGQDRRTGGGGSGGSSYGSTLSGAGGMGTAYSGGAGGAGSDRTAGSTSGSNIGGSGGNSQLGPSVSAGGGAGNPGGIGNEQMSYSHYGANGTGGLLILYGENVNNNGNIQSNGSIGGTPGNASGGSSGGGSVNIFYLKNITAGAISVDGGNAQYGYGAYGGAGGKGTVSIGNLVTGTYVKYN